MQIRPLAVPGAWEATPRQFADDRGVFLEWFTAASFEGAAGHRFDLAQANVSVSSRGVLRGIHVADVPPGQAKYVTCVAGAVLDVVVDLRVGSPTFGTWDSTVLDAVDRRAVYLSEGLGHGFVALEDSSTVVYLCSEPYAPAREHEVHPLDPELGIDWPGGMELLLSPKDAAAPTLAEARERGLLPSWEATEEYVARLRDSAP
jgi:dTDP-4-dehydrorhamnose 3,5-epimerase